MFKLIEKNNVVFTTLVYFVIVLLISFSDYFIYTNVFHLNQADFFNYFLPTISPNSSQDIFIVFLFIPLLFIGIFVLFYKIQYDFYKKEEIRNYFYHTDNCMYGVKVLSYICVGLIGGDYFIYGLITYLSKNFNLNVIFFLIELFLLFMIINLILYRTLLSIDVLAKKYAKDNKNIKLYVWLFFIGVIVIKGLLISWLLHDLFFAEYLNLSIFFLIIVFLVSHKNDTKEIVQNSLWHMGSIVFIFSIMFWMFFYNFEEASRRPYEKRSFWEKNNNANLFSTNFSFLFNPLKISQFNDIQDYKKISNENRINSLLESKQFSREVELDVNNSIKYLKNDFNNTKRKMFFLPNSDRRLLFIQDNNKTVTVFHIKENNDSSVKLVDIGYIKLQN
jgi:hypothetical protein